MGGIWMKLNRIAVGLIVGLIGIATLTPSLPVAEAQEGRTLSVRFHSQHTMVWCWAASIAMVVEYLDGKRIEDCEVLSLYDRSLGGPGRCCAADPRCMRGSRPNEIGPILGNIFGVHGVELPRSLTWREIVDNIDAGKPIIAWVWNSPQSAHVIVISGYASNPRTLTVLDPLRGSLMVPFDGFAANWGPSHNWNISWIFDRGVATNSTSTTQPRQPSKVRRTTACTHAAHPAGHVMPCTHGTQHVADAYACQHPCPGPFGPVPCHPYGHPGPCVHPAHPYGDSVTCEHPLHPNGDPVEDD